MPALPAAVHKRSDRIANRPKSAWRAQRAGLRSGVGRTEYYANRVDVELTIEGMALTV